jgi:hypothetical protein
LPIKTRNGEKPEEGRGSAKKKENKRKLRERQRIVWRETR